MDKSSDDEKSEVLAKEIKNKPVKILTQDFEMGDNEWKQKWDMINNAEIKKVSRFSKSRELVTSNSGFGEIEVYLNGATKATVSAIVLPKNKKTVIKYRHPNSDSDSWNVFEIPSRDKEYKLCTFPIAGPFNESGAYRLRFGTDGTDKGKSHFKEVQIVIFYD